LKLIVGNRRCQSRILTRLRLAAMIADMFRRVIAALLIIGWVALSGFDVVEDLDEIPGQIQISTAPDDAGPDSKRAMGSLANNSIESASRTKPANLAPVDFGVIIFRIGPLTEFRKHSQLHKLFRVFLI
jgi:hypothetical protein